MKVKLITILLSIAISTTYGQLQDFSNIDEYAISANIKHVKNVENLTAYLSENSTNDLEKVRSFYVWITNNISYDTKAFFSGDIKQFTPDEVLKKRKAVCQGYATLFKQMCDIENIECEIISGYSKGYGYNPNKAIKNKDHAWNAVKIDNEWHLIDATWGSGYLNEKNQFEKHFTNTFFYSDPTKFIYKHLPADPMWQLIQSPISFKVFQSDSNQIDSYLITADKTFSYSDSISLFQSMDDQNKKLTTALNEYNFNNHLSAPTGYAYMNIGFKRFNELLNNKNIDPNIAYTKQEEILRIYETALYYFNLNNDKSSLDARKICRNNIKSCKENLKVYQQMMEHQQKK